MADFLVEVLNALLPIAGMLLLIGPPALLASVIILAMIAAVFPNLKNKIGNKTKVALATPIACSMLIAGATLGFHTGDRPGPNSGARERVLMLVSMVEEDATTHGNRYPPSGASRETSRRWAEHHPADYNANPWGGSAGAANPLGIEEPAPVQGLYPTLAAAQAAAAELDRQAKSETLNLTPDPLKAANLIYVQIQPGRKGPWHAITSQSASTTTVVKGYAVGIYDKNGLPWWDVKGGK